MVYSHSSIEHFVVGNNLRNVQLAVFVQIPEGLKVHKDEPLRLNNSRRFKAHQGHTKSSMFTNIFLLSTSPSSGSHSKLLARHLT